MTATKLTEAQTKAAIAYATRDLRAQLALREEEIRKELEHIDLEGSSAHVLAEYGLEPLDGKIVTKELLKVEEEKLETKLAPMEEETKTVKKQTEEEKKPMRPFKPSPPSPPSFSFTPPPPKKRK